MANPVYTKFLIETILKALDGDANSQKWLQRREYRAGIEAHLAALQREIDGFKEQAASKDDVIHLIVSASPEGKHGAMMNLRQWMRGSNQIDIVDPYLLSAVSGWEIAEIEGFANDFASILPKRATVNLFVNGYSRSMHKAVWQKVKEGRIARLIQTNKYHDRFIIKDDEVKLIGTSFNGLGRKISALIDLNKEDAADIRKSVFQERTSGTKIAGPAF